MRGFNVGDVVICIDDKNIHQDFMPQYINKIYEGRVYTIRSIVDIGSGLYLEGVYNKINPWSGVEMGFKQRRFKKLKIIGSYKAITSEKEVECMT